MRNAGIRVNPIVQKEIELAQVDKATSITTNLSTCLQ